MIQQQQAYLCTDLQRKADSVPEKEAPKWVLWRDISFQGCYVCLTLQLTPEAGTGHRAIVLRTPVTGEQAQKGGGWRKLP